MTLESMAAAFGVSPAFMDAELAEFIVAGRVSAKIDKARPWPSSSPEVSPAAADPTPLAVLFYGRKRALAGLASAVLQLLAHQTRCASACISTGEKQQCNGACLCRWLASSRQTGQTRRTRSTRRRSSRATCCSTACRSSPGR